jgi:hypothetical protein
MSRMRARRLGTWLAILAITLQAAWPLLANARLRGVTLVPLCTVDGVTHYLEVPTGKDSSESSAHGDHCPLCFVGERVALPANFAPPILLEASPDDLVGRPQALFSTSLRSGPGARAPPYSPLSAV